MNRTLVKAIDEEIKFATKEHLETIKDLKRLIVEENKIYEKELNKLATKKEQALNAIKMISVIKENVKRTNFQQIPATKRLAIAKKLLKAWGNRYFCDKQPSNAHRSIKPIRTLSLAQKDILRKLADKVNTLTHDKNWRAYYGDRLKDGRWSVTRYIFYTTK